MITPRVIIELKKKKKGTLYYTLGTIGFTAWETGGIKRFTFLEYNGITNLQPNSLEYPNFKDLCNHVQKLFKVEADIYKLNKKQNNET